ncbi:MAG: ParB N-terminal domain-containing protein [Thiotrichales bacterium]|nr:ParB N-terminal domain-containing protein [Thiotrichales bacterium]
MTQSKSQQPVINVKISDLITDTRRFQVRTTINRNVVARYTEMAEVSEAPPVLVWKEPETGKLYLVHGFHRTAAYTSLGRIYIPAIMLEGSESDAIKEACVANVHNGHALSSFELKSAIERYLELAPTESNRQIGRLFGVSEKTIRNYRARIRAQELTKGWDRGTTRLALVGKDNLPAEMFYGTFLDVMFNGDIQIKTDYPSIFDATIITVPYDEISFSGTEDDIPWRQKDFPKTGWFWYANQRHWIIAAVDSWTNWHLETPRKATPNSGSIVCWNGKDKLWVAGQVAATMDPLDYLNKPPANYEEIVESIKSSKEHGEYEIPLYLRWLESARSVASFGDLPTLPPPPETTSVIPAVTPAVTPEPEELPPPPPPVQSTMPKSSKTNKAISAPQEVSPGLTKSDIETLKAIRNWLETAGDLIPEMVEFNLLSQSQASNIIQWLNNTRPAVSSLLKSKKS